MAMAVDWVWWMCPSRARAHLQFITIDIPWARQAVVPYLFLGDDANNKQLPANSQSLAIYHKRIKRFYIFKGRGMGREDIVDCGGWGDLAKSARGGNCRALAATAEELKGRRLWLRWGRFREIFRDRSWGKCTQSLNNYYYAGKRLDFVLKAVLPSLGWVTGGWGWGSGCAEDRIITHLQLSSSICSENEKKRG